MIGRRVKQIVQSQLTMTIVCACIGIVLWKTATRWSNTHWYVSSVSYSPDRQTIAVGVYRWRRAPYETDPRYLITGIAQSVKLIDAKTGVALQTIDEQSFDGTTVGLSPQTHAWVRYAPDGKTLAIGTWDGQIKIYDTTSWTLQSVRPCRTGRITTLQFSPGGNFLAVGGRLGVEVIDLRRPETMTIASESIAMKSLVRVLSLSFSPDSTQLAIGSNFDGVLIYEVATGDLLSEWEWDASTGSLVTSVQSIPPETESVEWVSFSPDGEFLAVSGAKRGNDSKAAKVVHLESETETATFPDRYGPIKFSSTGDRVAVGGYNGLHILDTSTKGREFSFRRTTGVLSLDWSHDDTNLISGSTDGTVELWNCESGARIWESYVGGWWQ